MKRSLYFVLLISFLILSCSKENDKPTIEPTTDLEFKLDTYGLFNIDKQFEGYATGIDTNQIYFNGRLDNKLCVEAFNKSSKSNVLSWVSNDKLTIEVHEGYGVNSTHQISWFETRYPYNYNDDHAYILLGFAEGSQYLNDKRIITSDLYFSSVNKKYKSMTYPSKAWFYYRVNPWYEDHIIVRKKPAQDWSALPDSLICYSMKGDEIFRFADHHTGTKSVHGGIAVSVTNMIRFSGQKQGVFIHKNIHTDEIVWESAKPLTDLPEDTRLDEEEYSRVDANSVLYKINYTHYSGETGSREIIIDIATGKLTVK